MKQLNFVYGAAPSYAKIKDTVKGHSEKKKKKNAVVTIHQAMCCTNESEIFFTLLEA